MGRVSKKWTVDRIVTWLEGEGHGHGAICPDGTCDMIRYLLSQLEECRRELAEAKKTGGYTCHVCGALRTECEIMKRAKEETALECAEIAKTLRERDCGVDYGRFNNCPEEEILSKCMFCIEREIRAKFNLTQEV